MKIGDIVFGVMPLSRGYDIEDVLITDEKIQKNSGGDIEYFEIKHLSSYGVSGLLKNRVFHTREEAIEFRDELLKSDARKFMDELESKEDFFKYLYEFAACDMHNDIIRNFITEKIKEYTGVDVLHEDESIQ